MKRIIGIVICVAMIFSLSSCAFFEDILTRSVNIVEKEKVFTFEIGYESLGFYLPDGTYTVEPGKFEIYLGPKSTEGSMIEIKVK